MHLNSQLFDKLNLPEGFFDRGSVLRNLVRYDATSVLVLLEDVNIIVA
jgi:hypothetical protein